MQEIERLRALLDDLGIPHVDEPQSIALDTHRRVVFGFDKEGTFDHVRVNDDVIQRGGSEPEARASGNSQPAE